VRDDQRYVADSFRTSGIGLMVAGLISLFFGKAPLLSCMSVIGIGIAVVTIGYYYVKRRTEDGRV